MSSFVKALQQRYCTVDTATYAADAFSLEGKKHQKSWEMVGMDKVLRQQSRLDRLMAASLVDANVTMAFDVEHEAEEKAVLAAMRQLRSLDLSGNSTLTFATVDIIVQALPALEVLQLNRTTAFSAVPSVTVGVPSPSVVWRTLTTLTLNDVGLVTLRSLAVVQLPLVTELHMDFNIQLGRWLEEDALTSEAVALAMPNVSTISLIACGVDSWAALAAMHRVAFPRVTSWGVGRNRLRRFDNDEHSAVFVNDTLPHVTSLDITENNELCDNGGFLVTLRRAPHLRSLRVSYDTLFQKAFTEAQARRIVVVTIPNLTHLNNAAIRAKERLDAEIAYLQLGMWYARRTADATAPQTSEPRCEYSFPMLAELRERHRDTIVTDSVSNSMSDVVVLTIRCDGMADDVHRLPSATPLQNIRRLAMAHTGIPANSLVMRGWSTDDAGVVARPVELRGDAPLGLFGLGENVVISVEKA